MLMASFSESFEILKDIFDLEPLAIESAYSDDNDSRTMSDGLTSGTNITFNSPSESEIRIDEKYMSDRFRAT